MLSDRPIRPEEPSAVNVLEMLEEILTQDPKYLEDDEPDVNSNRRCNERRHCQIGGRACACGQASIPRTHRSKDHPIPFCPTDSYAAR